MINPFENLNILKTIKVIVLIKIVIVVLFLLVQKQWIKIGDVPTLAQNAETAPKADTSAPQEQETKAEQDVGDKGEEKSKDEDSKEEGKDDGIKAEDSPSPSGPMLAEAAAPKSRKGYLEDLISLPSLDVEKVQKDEIGRYLNLIETAKQQIQDRQALLEEKGKQLTQLEQNIDKKLKDLDEERQYFAKTIQREKEIKQDRLQTLVQLYEKMEPKKAAPILEKMDKDLVVALFKALKQKQVTKILESMTPEKSNEISEYYGRIGSAREYDLLKEMNASLRKAFDDCKGLPKEEQN